MQMRMINYHIDYRHFKRTILISIAIATVLLCGNEMTSIMYMMHFWTEQPLKNIIFFSAMNAISNFAAMTCFIIYSYFLLSIRIRFRLVNDALRNTLDAPESVVRLHGSASDEVIHVLNVLTELHVNMVEGVGTINECYSFQVSVSKTNGNYSTLII